MKKHVAATVIALVFVEGSAHAAPGFGLFLDSYVEVFGPDSLIVGKPAGDYINLDADVTSAFDPGTVSVVATYSLDPTIAVTLTYSPSAGGLPGGYFGFATDASLTGAWSVLATDQSGATGASIPAIVNPQILPLVANLTVHQNGTTPTISWGLPDLTGFDVDRIRLRIHDSSGLQIYNRNMPSTATTSFTMPDGLLQVGQAYNFRLQLMDFDTNGFENRSNTFTGNVTLVPEPSQYALLSVGLFTLLALSRRHKAELPGHQSARNGF